MINQQLIDYIRQQTTAGITKEAIKTSLIPQGWSEQDINEGFTIIEKPTTVLTNTQNTIWTKVIPRTNIVFVIIFLLLVFGLDLSIIISSPDLRSFWYMMLGVLALFSVFFCLENFIFRKKFKNTTSSFDKGILVAVVVRNFVFLLNFIPLIQIIGLLALAYIGWIILLSYLVFMTSRYYQTR